MLVMLDIRYQQISMDNRRISFTGGYLPLSEYLTLSASIRWISIEYLPHFWQISVYTRQISLLFRYPLVSGYLYIQIRQSIHI